MARLDLQERAAKEWAAEEKGWHGRQGGWIYTASGATPITQGWWNVWSMFRLPIRDYYTQKLTAFRTFRALIQAEGGYRPTLLARGPRDWRYRFLADEYDAWQEKRGDPRRAYRGG